MALTLMPTSRTKERFSLWKHEVTLELDILVLENHLFKGTFFDFFSIGSLPPSKPVIPRTTRHSINVGR